MILSSLISFLGGSAFRFIIGQATDWLQKRQAHLQEIERLREQEKIDQAAHVRQMDQIKLQADLKLGEIKLVGETQVGTAEAQAFVEAMKVTNTPTGVKWIDAWNGSIRPLIATIATLLWLLKVVQAGLVLTQWDSDLISAVFGYYFADRHISKAGK